MWLRCSTKSFMAKSFKSLRYGTTHQMACLAAFVFVFAFACPLTSVYICPNLMQFGKPSKKSFDFAREQLERCNSGNALRRIYMVMLSVDNHLIQLEINNG